MIQIVEGLIETIYVKDNNIPLIKYHRSRLKKGLEFFKVPGADDQLEEIFSDVVWHAERFDAEHAKLRLKFFLQNRDCEFDVETLSDADMEAYSQPIKLMVYEEKLKPFTPWQNLKTTDRDIYIEAYSKAQKAGFDDAIIVNKSGKMVETCRCNIWWVKNGELLTPALSEGSVEGTWRTMLMENFQGKINEISAGVDELLTADEVIVTNAIGGPMHVSRINDRTFEDNTVYLDLKELAREVLSGNY